MLERKYQFEDFALAVHQGIADSVLKMCFDVSIEETIIRNPINFRSEGQRIFRALDESIEVSCEHE